MNPIEHTGPQMPTDRWRALMADDNLKLTEEELKAGWHFCWEFDGLLVGPGMMEQEFCHCLEMPRWSISMRMRWWGVVSIHLSSVSACVQRQVPLRFVQVAVALKNSPRRGGAGCGAGGP